MCIRDSFLNCSVDQAYSSIRTYYGRIYEAKFITGAIAGAMAQNNRIGYIASYPIFGVPASINAFALGAQMTNPRAQIELRWSCVKGTPQADLLADGIRGEEAEEAAQLSAGALFMQGIATSIDALSVGFTISEYGWLMALTAAIIIAVVTFILCMAGLRIGKKFGTQLSGKANILGGVILIGIGLEIFITGVF